MSRPTQRETFVALRATRTAHQVARAVMNPHLELPEAQRIVLPEDQVLRYEQRFHPEQPPPPSPPMTWQNWVALLVILLVASILITMPLWVMM
jgi:hypothetical protein